MRILLAVTEFAKKTGDFAVLSAVDLRVLALTYMLEVELTHGASHLRQEPHKVRSKLRHRLRLPPLADCFVEMLWHQWFMERM